MNGNDRRYKDLTPLEDELTTLPGPKPGTALRVRYDGDPDGCVCLEQLAYSAGLGWYVQKSLTIPAEMLPQLIPQLRKADCLRPRPMRIGQESYALFPQPVTDRDPTPCPFGRRGA